MKINSKLHRILFFSSFFLSLFTFLVPVCLSIFHSLKFIKYGNFTEAFIASYINLTLELHISDNLIMAYNLLICISFAMSIISFILFLDKRQLFKWSILLVIMSIFYPVGRIILLFLAILFS